VGHSFGVGCVSDAGRGVTCMSDVVRPACT
jgi:hypothetical protein